VVLLCCCGGLEFRLFTGCVVVVGHVEAVLEEVLDVVQVGVGEVGYLGVVVGRAYRSFVAVGVGRRLAGYT